MYMHTIVLNVYGILIIKLILVGSIDSGVVGQSVHPRKKYIIPHQFYCFPVPFKLNRVITIQYYYNNICLYLSE